MMVKLLAEGKGSAMKIKHGKILTQEEREYLANEREKRKRKLMEAEILLARLLKKPIHVIDLDP